MQTSIASDRTGDEWKEYFSYHGGILANARDTFIEATRAYYAELKKCGAIERAQASEETFVTAVLDAAHAPLSEEIKDYLIW